MEWNGRSIILEKRNVLRLDFKESREGFRVSVGKEWKVIPCIEAEDRKGNRTHGGNSSTRTFPIIPACEEVATFTQYLFGGKLSTEGLTLMSVA